MRHPGLLILPLLLLATPACDKRDAHDAQDPARETTLLMNTALPATGMAENLPIPRGPVACTHLKEPVSPDEFRGLLKLDPAEISMLIRKQAVPFVRTPPDERTERLGSILKSGILPSRESIIQIAELLSGRRYVERDGVGMLESRNPATQPNQFERRVLYRVLADLGPDLKPYCEACKDRPELYALLQIALEEAGVSLDAMRVR